MKTLVVHLSIPGSFVEKIREIVPDWNVVQTQKGEYDEALLKKAEIIVEWSGKTAKSCLKGNSDLRWVHTWAAGVESMPLEEFNKRGIWLTNSSGVHADPISETIFALMLTLTRKIHVGICNQKDHIWQANTGLREIHGKTLGLLGMGSIGSETARLAKAFNMKVIGFRRTGRTAPYADEVVGKDSLEYLVSKSDYLVNTLPLTKETKHLIDSRVFGMMKSGAYYINVGRGGTTDTEALIDAVRKGQIAGAGLDVFEEEPLPADSPLWDMKNIIILPHESGLTEYYDQRALDIFIRNLKEYLQGHTPPINLVDPYQGY